MTSLKTAWLADQRAAVIGTWTFARCSRRDSQFSDQVLAINISTSYPQATMRTMVIALHEPTHPSSSVGCRRSRLTWRPSRYASAPNPAEGILLMSAPDDELAGSGCQCPALLWSMPGVTLMKGSSDVEIRYTKPGLQHICSRGSSPCRPRNAAGT
jgi:hypothetical protein